MKKVFTVLFVLILSVGKSNAQSTWVPEGDYRLYNYDSLSTIYGVKYTASLVNSDSTVYSNYVQVQDSNGLFMNPKQAAEYVFADSISVFGHQFYYPQADQVRLFRLRLLFPNHPKAQSTWMTLSDYKNGLHVDASSADWTYDASIQDSVLSIMLNVKNATNQVIANDSLNGCVVVYGQTKGLLSFDVYLVNPWRKGEIYSMIFSKKQGFGELPAKAEDVFTYSPGMEIHSKIEMYGAGMVGTTYIRRKVISSIKLGSTLIHTDSVWKITYQSSRTGQYTWTPLEVKNKSFGIETDSIHLDIYSYLNSSHTNTALHPFDSASNQLFSIKINTSPVSQFELYVSRALPAATEVTPNPPYAYVAQHTLQEMDEHFVYYLGAGGPYRRFNSIAGGENEYVVYLKNGNVEKGTPHTASLLNSERSIASLDVELYPNPAKNQVQLQVSQEANWNATIYCMDGKAIQHFTFEGDAQTINISSLENGLYFIRLTSLGYTSTVRMQVSK